MGKGQEWRDGGRERGGEGMRERGGREGEREGWMGRS